MSAADFYAAARMSIVFMKYGKKRHGVAIYIIY